MSKSALVLLFGSVAGLSLAAAPTPARADAPAISQSAPPRPRSLSLTFAPILLLGKEARVLEVTGEARLTDTVGVGLMLAAGKITEQVVPLLPKESATVLEAGLSARYYLVGDFRHGMQLGAETVYLRTSGDVIRVNGDGLNLGPFVGYKYTAGFGLTLEVQLGYAVKIASRSNDVKGVRVPKSDDEKRRVFMHANVGWSF